MLKAEILKKDFPILSRSVNGKPLVYLDNASTSQKPCSVVKALSDFYFTMNANIHRGIHTLSEEATEAYETSRKKVAQFINAKEAEEIIFTKNATEAINLVARSYGDKYIKENDVVVVTALEHHSNLVPWQELCKRKGAYLRVIPIYDDGTLDLSKLDKIIDSKTKIVAVTQMSNVLGTITDLPKIIAAAHAVGAVALIDAAQGIAHMGIDVQKLQCDFAAFSGHKMLGPNGVGVLYGKRAILEQMPPFLFGGDMVREVSQTSATFNDLPYKFEAGTPPIAEVCALTAAIEYIEKVGLKNILEHDRELLAYARKKLEQMPGVILYGPKNIENAGGILSFNVLGVHPHDVGSILNDQGVAIRSGHHCCQPLMQRLGVSATARMSFYLYNTKEDIDAAASALKKVFEIFKVKV